MTDESSKKSSRFQNYVTAEAMVQIALSIPAGCFVGWLIGAWMDRHFHTGWITIVGVFVGALGGIAQLISIASHYMKDDK